jgi:histidinol-phosphate aminotransferase
MSAPTPRASILEIMPYKGGEGVLPGFDKVIKLASNEGALGPSPKAMAALGDIRALLHRYPDGGARRLREAIAKRFKLDVERIVCGGGSDQLISLIISAFAGPGDEVLYSAHGFLWYPIAARGAGATPVAAPERNLTADVDALIAALPPRTRVVLVANPNNPTGTYLPKSEIARLDAALPSNVVLVLDGAYAEYVERDDYSPGIDLVDSSENVVMTRTFSKMYALSALRLGWAYGSTPIIDAVNRLRTPFNVNEAAIAAGIAALNDSEHEERTRAHTAKWRAWLSDEMKKIGLEVPPSEGNFVLACFPEAPGKTAHEADDHLRSKGIIVRRQDPSGLKHALRITIGTEEETRAVAAALGEFMAR